MLSKFKKLYRAIIDCSEVLARLSEMDTVLNRIDSLLQSSKLSPVERQVFLTLTDSNEGLFHYSYEKWRARRINKIIELYGFDYFKGKNILELGSGHGDIGAFFADLGLMFFVWMGEEKNVDFARLKHHKVERLKFQQFDLEKDFSEFGNFDLVINFGLLYHIKKVDEHLVCCFKMADEVVFESVVCDSTDPYNILFCDEDVRVNEDALHGIGSRPSPFYIERVAQKNGFEIIRCFDKDLNAGPQFCYDWEHKNDGRITENLSLRRFWRFSRMLKETNKTEV